MWMLIFASLLIGGLLFQVCIFSVTIWGSAKMLRVAEATMVGAGKIGLMIYGVCIVTSLLDLLATALDAKVTRSIAFIVVALCAIATVWVIIKRRLQCSRAKAAGIAAITLLLSFGVSYPLMLAIRKTTAAFVVPTGSMATTIIGYHAHIKCGNCGQEFDISMSDRAVGRNPYLNHSAEQAICPNCGQLIAVPAQIEVLGGDRLLVDKMSVPQRWDNIAYWIRAARPGGEPESYIKRLVGFPNESVAIFDGDVFIDGRRLVKKPDELLDLWIPMHDSSLAPKKTDAETPRWQSDNAAGWVTFDNKWKIASHVNSESILAFNGKLTDRLAYNTIIADEPQGFTQENLVGDVRVDCNIDSFSGTGYWGIRWQFAGRDVHCKFTADGAVDLACQSTGAGSNTGQAGNSSAGRLIRDFRRPQMVSLAVRDGWAYVLDNGHPCVSLQIASEKLADVEQQSNLQPGNLSLFALQCELVIPRITIFRDVYYTQPVRTTRATYGHEVLIHLGEKELYFLGDNSQRSKDSRYDGPSSIYDIIGVVRCRYWPPSRWHSF
jgi:signal peptidase I